MIKNNPPRTIKVSADAYKSLSHQSKEEDKPIEEIATAIIIATLSNEPKPADVAKGEQYNPKTGKRIFRTVQFVAVNAPPTPASSKKKNG